MSGNDMMLDDLLGDFLDESAQIIERLNENLLTLDRWASEHQHGGSVCDPDLLNETFRAAHSLKGLSAMLGLSEINCLTHHIENVLDAARNQQLKVVPQVVQVVFHAVDRVGDMVARLSDPTAEPVDYSHSLEMIDQLLKDSQAASAPATQAAMDHLFTQQLHAGPEASIADTNTLAGVQDETNIPAKSLDMFIDEAEGSLDHFSEALLKIALGVVVQPDDLVLATHRIYASAALIGLHRIAKLAQVMEDLLQWLRDSATPLAAQHAHVLLPCADALRAYVAELKTAGASAGAEFPALVQTLIALRSACEAAVAESPSVTHPNSPLGKEDCASTSKGDSGKPSETLRVDIERLDQLMSLASELLINRSRFERIGAGLRTAMELNGDNELPRLSQAHTALDDLAEAVDQLGLVADGIQRSVMETRLVPVGPFFNRFKRVLRDVTRTNGKEIELDIRGAKTKLDKRIIDELGDPLIHMVRNSADHGIESPADRIAKGKPRHGTLALKAFHRGNSIFIQISDDGKGLDAQRIRNKAVEKRIITAADAERLTRQQVFQLIWEPGFSTAEKVTEISGRGMGMDIVRSKIEQLGGAVELTSEPGEGTVFTIKLPLTLAILPSLLSQRHDEVFAFPLESVLEIVEVQAESITTVHSMATVTVRGRIISVLELCELPTWQTQIPIRPHSGTVQLVVLSHQGREIGLIVDQLIGEEDLVIKSSAENLLNRPGLNGVSILGDGRAAFLVDPAALMDHAAGVPQPAVAH
jgi:two-component system chemotaxis sensor kinase CheA